MTEFKVGDRVRRIKHTSKYVSNCPIGYEADVVDLAGNYGIWYNGSDGNLQNSTYLQDWEFVKTTELSAVRTVTRREIVPGLYGRVKVGNGVLDGHVAVCFVTRDGEPLTIGGAALNATELRSVCMILSQLAEALEDQK